MTLEAFLADRNLLALKTNSAALGKGLFRREVTIPLHTSGLVFHSDGNLALLTEGRKVDGDFEIVLAKNGTIVLELMFPDLRSSDSFPVSATVRIAVSIDTRRIDVFKDFVASLFTFPGTLSTRDVKTFLAPELKRVLSELISASPAEQLHRKDLSRDVDGRLAPTLERLFFGQGLRYEKLVDSSFLSVDFESRQKADAQRRENEHRLSEERDDKERQLRRFLGFLEDPQVKGILETLPDDRIKGLILAELLRDKNASITAEELIRKSARHGEEVVQAILESLQKLMGATPVPSHAQVVAESAERIFVAAGSTVYEVRPGEPEPAEHRFPEALRSVRFSATLLGGSKRAVYVLSPSGQVLGYPLPGAKDPRGGVNAIASGGPYLFATHSEYGLARWRAAEPGAPGELLYSDLTLRNKTTRAVQISGDRIFFATGSEVYASSLHDGSNPVRFGSDPPSTVTCLVVCGSALFAGTEDGSIWGWDAAEPDRPSLVARKKERIVTLRLAKIGGIPHLFYSTRDLAVRARALGLNLEIAYESGGASVDFLDAASDLVCASDSSGRKLLVWKSTAPARPDIEVDIWRQAGKPILDLWMKKVPSPTS